MVWKRYFLSDESSHLLAYLEQINFSGKIFLNLIDDETFKIVERGIDVKLGVYKKQYNDILVKKINVTYNGVILQNAINLYFDYLSDNGTLAEIVKNSLEWDENELVAKLMRQSADYGLSDLQAKKLIEKYKEAEAK